MRHWVPIDAPMRHWVPIDAPMRHWVPIDAPMRHWVPIDAPMRHWVPIDAPMHHWVPIDAPMRHWVPIDAPIRHWVPIDAPVKVAVISASSSKKRRFNAFLEQLLWCANGKYLKQVWLTWQGLPLTRQDVTSCKAIRTRSEHFQSGNISRPRQLESDKYSCSAH